MDTEELFGINEGKLNLLVAEVNEIAESINRKFNEIERLTSDTKNYFNCSSADEFRKKFDQIREAFPVVNQNILNISYDLVNAKNRVKNVNNNVILSVNAEVRNMGIRNN